MTQFWLVETAVFPQRASLPYDLQAGKKDFGGERIELFRRVSCGTTHRGADAGDLDGQTPTMLVGDTLVQWWVTFSTEAKLPSCCICGGEDR